MERPIDVSIIVVSFNTRALTLACLDSVLAQTIENRCELLAVDNASDDGSAAAMARHPSKPRLIALSENIGFARANNLAASAATGEHILLLNPDTVVLDGAIDRLMTFARAHPAAGIWGGRTVFADGRLNPASCWARMSPWNLLCRAAGLTGLAPHSTLLNGEAYGGWQRNTEREVDIVSGCFLLIPRALWDRLGGFDPAFFMYGEDADLCLRARRLGARPMVTPDATILHHGGASETARTDKMVRLLAAKALLIERHWPPPLVPIGLALLTAWPLSRWWALTVLHRFRPAQSLGEAARTWREIWARRAVWLRSAPRLSTAR